MATIEDKLTAEIVQLKPFTYDQARTALQARPRQKNVSELARQWGVPRSTARRWVARFKDETKAARRAANSVAHSVAIGAQTGQPSGAPALHQVPRPAGDTGEGLSPPALLQPEPDVTPDRHDGHPEGSRVASVLLAGTALILAGVGLLTNAQFAASLGQTPVSSTLLAALGFAIDGLALILPSVAGVLWRGRHRLASVSAWAVWAGAVTVTLIAAAGFAAGNIGDSVTARGAKIAERAELTARI